MSIITDWILSWLGRFSPRKSGGMTINLKEANKVKNMESELFTLPQTELMLKLHEYNSSLDDEELTDLEERLLSVLGDVIETLTEEELQVIKEEQQRLIDYNKTRNEAEAFLRQSEKFLTESYSSDYIKGMEVGDTYFS